MVELKKKDKKPIKTYSTFPKVEKVIVGNSSLNIRTSVLFEDKMTITFNGTPILKEGVEYTSILYNDKLYAIKDERNNIFSIR